MPNRDFIDEDLVKPREDLNRIRMGPADQPAGHASETPASDGPSRRVSDLDLPLMARRKQNMELESASKAEELERLRQRQQDIEREKRDLEETRRKQTDYGHGKQELLDRLNESVVFIERHEIKTEQLADMLQNARRRFRAMLEDISAIQEDTWTEGSFREQLGKSLVVIEDARMEYNKTMAKIQAVLGGDENAAKPVVFENRPIHAEPAHGFRHWLLVGLAASLPLIVVLILITVVFLLHSMGLI